MRPHITSTYFKRCNVVDAHNQARQFESALEKKWVTHNAYFRLYTTILGMIITNLWKIVKRIQGNQYHSTRILDFADELTFEIIEENKSEEGDIVASVNTMESENETISSVSCEAAVVGYHVRTKLDAGK